MLEPGFKRWLTDTDTIILVCWDLGHVWDADLYDSIERIRHGSFAMTGSCERGCGVVRTRVMTSSWTLDSSKNSYKYPRGYSPKDVINAKGREWSPFFMSAEHRAAIRRELNRRANESKKPVGKKTSGAEVVKVKFTG